MQGGMKTAMLLCLSCSIVYAAIRGNKLRRDPVKSSMVPFPRIGRSQGSWIPPHEDSEVKIIEKRQLYAFPRVGRPSIPSNYEVFFADQGFQRPQKGQWDLNKALRSLDNDGKSKRQLYAFPRVGRTASRSGPDVPDYRTLQSDYRNRPPKTQWNRPLRSLLFGEKPRRDTLKNPLNVYPRVGRAQTSWIHPLDDYDLADEKPLEKRQLYAFPRVGRSDSSPDMVESPMDILQEVGNTNGMWFGPRLGRSGGNEENDSELQKETSDPEKLISDIIDSKN